MGAAELVNCVEKLHLYLLLHKEKGAPVDRHNSLCLHT